MDSDGLEIDLAVNPVDATTVDVAYRIHGVSTAWSAPDTHEPIDVSGPRYTSVSVDSEDVGGSDGGDIECRRGAPALPYDETWKGEDDSGLRVPVPGPGTYAITVDAPYCGADGEVVPNKVSNQVTVPGS